MSIRTSNFLQRYYGNQHAAKVIYGIILMFVALIGLSSSGVKSAQAAALDAFMGGITILIAEDYAEIIGFTIKHKRALSKRERMEIFEDSLAICSFILVPSVILIISKLQLYTLEAAFNLSFAYCLLVLFVFSLWAGRLSNFSYQKAVLIATLNAAVGLIIILFKYIFTH